MANNKYQIWDKTSHVFTPIGEDLIPEQWINRYGWIKNPAAVPVVAAGIINGGYSGELSQMTAIAEDAGAVFEDGLTNEELLDAIAEFEDSMNRPSDESTPEERIAAALEYNNMLNSPVINPDDPDEE